MAIAQTQLLTLLQISDSAFPTGGFSHSLGLEAAVKFRLVEAGNLDVLEQFTVAVLENTGSFSLPFVTEAYESSGNFMELKKLSDMCDACTSNHVAKRASTRQGRSLLSTSARTFKNELLQHFQEFSEAQADFQIHYPVMFGHLCRILGVDLSQCQTAFMFGSLRTLLASAVRLDVVGALEAQALQNKMQSFIPDIISKYRSRKAEEACVSFPLPEVLQNSQDTLFSKLFYS
ncbi:urease accessory protein F-like [Lingula anatina]|uniref:Urease accessory protein F-like n=1 Tax=Lingula anatina TaxID=7574 RepID=A0A1S3JXK5_LINAN|nr:urease accessory protein F-like [Lingula anatina]|eukprot:XP_013414784.1 urease accessory protein F-like [Lingula anatina]